MLILTRKLGESINIGKDIKILVVDIKRNQVRIGVEAPLSTAVHRNEIYDRIKLQNLASINHTAKSNIEPLGKFLLSGDINTKTNHKALILKNLKKSEKNEI